MERASAAPVLTGRMAAYIFSQGKHDEMSLISHGYFSAYSTMEM